MQVLLFILTNDNPSDFASNRIDIFHMISGYFYLAHDERDVIVTEFTRKILFDWSSSYMHFTSYRETAEKTSNHSSCCLQFKWNLLFRDMSIASDLQWIAFFTIAVRIINTSFLIKYCVIGSNLFEWYSRVAHSQSQQPPHRHYFHRR